MDNEEPTMNAEEIAFAEIIGDLVEQWGFKRHLGRIWSLLYMRKGALSPKQIQTELSLSAGAVNALLAELQMWGVVKRIRIAGDRNFYYEAETHIWKSVSNVLRTREFRILEEAISGLKALNASLEKDSKRDLAVFQLKRVQHVLAAIDTAYACASIFLGAAPERMNKLTKLISRFRGL